MGNLRNKRNVDAYESEEGERETGDGESEKIRRGREKRREKSGLQLRARERYIHAILFRHFSQMQPRRALSRPFILTLHSAPSPDYVLFSRNVYFPAG